MGGGGWFDGVCVDTGFRFGECEVRIVNLPVSERLNKNKDEAPVSERMTDSEEGAVKFRRL